MKKFFFPLIVVFFCLIIAGRAEASDKVVVVIDPGHGGSSEDDAENGARYNDDLSEKDINLVTSLAMRDELIKYNNVEVHMTREDDRKLSLGARVEYAKSVGADVMVCCHYNASADHLFYGSEIFTSAFGDCYRIGNALGQCIMEQWTNDGLDEKGIKVRIGKNGDDYYGVIRRGCNANLPVIIIEHGYLDNHIDYARLGTHGDWERMGRLDATGIAEYYGLSKDTTLDEVFPTFYGPEPDGYVEPDLTEPENVSLKLTEFNIDTSEVTYEIKASESDGRLMYYGLALGDPEQIEPVDYADLILWGDSGNTVTGTFPVPTGYRGKITARVYNTYELYSDSLSEDIDMQTLIDERREELEGPKIGAAKARKNAAETAERIRREQEQASEREKVGDFTLLVGGRGSKDGPMDENTKKRLIGIAVTLFIILTVTLICIAIYTMRKKIVKYIKDREDL